MYEARSDDYIQFYESIVIEFFLRLKIHELGTSQDLIWTKFRKQFIVSTAKSETLAVWLCSGMVKPVHCTRRKITIGSESTVWTIDWRLRSILTIDNGCRFLAFCQVQSALTRSEKLCKLLQCFLWDEIFLFIWYLTVANYPLEGRSVAVSICLHGLLALRILKRMTELLF